MPQSTLLPVFLHAGWRTGSTYLWTRFRELEGVRAFYEPLNEVLLDLTIATLPRYASEAWGSNHPKIKAPYYEEYRSFIGDSGVEHFKPALPYRRFFMGPEEDDPALYRYLDNLIRKTQADGLTPVLGFCRSLGRMPWIWTCFEGTHVYLMRHHRNQWMSQYQQKLKNKNNYFLTMNYLIAGQNHQHPAIKPLADHLGIKHFVSDRPTREFEFYNDLYGNAPVRDAYLVFYYLYMVCHRLAEAYGDLIIDIDEISTNLRARSLVQIQMIKLTGLTPTFGDADVKGYRERSDDAQFGPIEAVADKLLAGVKTAIDALVD